MSKRCIQYYMAASKIGSKALQTLPPKEGQQLYLTRLQMKAIAQGLHSNDVSDRTIVDIKTNAAGPSHGQEEDHSHPFVFDHLDDSTVGDETALKSALTASVAASNADNVLQNDIRPSIHLMTNSQKHEFQLLQLLQDQNAPNYAFAQIMKWARSNAYLSGYDFCSEHKDYNVQIRYLDQWFSSSHNLRPIKHTVMLRFDNYPIPVVSFDFTGQLMSLFQDVTLNSIENLAVHPTDPFRHYSSPNGCLGEVNSGEHLSSI